MAAGERESKQVGSQHTQTYTLRHTGREREREEGDRERKLISYDGDVFRWQGAVRAIAIANDSSSGGTYIGSGNI